MKEMVLLKYGDGRQRVIRIDGWIEDDNDDRLMLND